MCISIDMSGSVCGPNTLCDSSCDCGPVSPITDRDTCCPNYLAIQDFTQDVITRIDSEQFRETVPDKQFSLVKFSTNGQVVTELVNGATATSIVSTLVYTGGFTNHQEALNACQTTFDLGDGTPDFLLLVTDGVPNRPEGEDARNAGLVAATAIKDSGTTIDTLFISNNNNADTIQYMKDLSSDNTVRIIDNFGGLEEIIDDVALKIACGNTPTSTPTSPPTSTPTSTPTSVSDRFALLCFAYTSHSIFNFELGLKPFFVELQLTYCLSTLALN